MRKKINKAIALLAVLGILAGSGNVVYGNEENIADQEEQLTKEKESIYIDNTGCYEGMETSYSEGYVPEITENEVYAFLQKCLVMLPENCAQVMNLYLSGYEMEEIAGQLNLSLQTVYNTKSMAIRLLKEKFGKTNFINLLFCFLCKVNATSPTR